MSRNVVLSSAAATLSSWRRRLPQTVVPDVEQEHSSSRRPLLHVELPYTPSTQYIRTYGTLHGDAGPITDSSSTQIPEDVIEDDLDEEDEEERELEQEGLYRGIYFPNVWIPR